MAWTGRTLAVAKGLAPVRTAAGKPAGGGSSANATGASRKTRSWGRPMKMRSTRADKLTTIRAALRPRPCPDARWQRTAVCGIGSQLALAPSQPPVTGWGPTKTRRASPCGDCRSTFRSWLLTSRSQPNKQPNRRQMRKYNLKAT